MSKEESSDELQRKREQKEKKKIDPTLLAAVELAEETLRLAEEIEALHGKTDITDIEAAHTRRRVRETDQAIKRARTQLGLTGSATPQQEKTQVGEGKRKKAKVVPLRRKEQKANLKT